MFQSVAQPRCMLNNNQWQHTSNTIGELRVGIRKEKVAKLVIIMNNY